MAGEGKKPKVSKQGCRRKGSRFERELVAFMRAGRVAARRVPLSGATAYAKGDVEILRGGFAPDMDPDGIGAAAWLEALRVECKRRAKLPALFAELGEFDALACREDRGEILVVVRASLLRELLR